MTITRSVPLMMNVPCSVIIGKSPMKTRCSRISPVSLLTKRTVIESGTWYVRSFSRHSLIENCGSPNSYSPNSTASVPV